MPFPKLERLAGQGVFLTGATGFIGQRVVAGLLANHANVTALLRSRHGADRLRRMGVRVIVGSLSNKKDLASALSGQSTVIHLAYDVRGSADSNVAAFDMLFDSARQAGVERFVHVSSIVVYDDWPDFDIDEDSRAESSDGRPYRQAKLNMEKRLMTGDLPAAIIQPTLVYGPGSALWTDAIADKLESGTVVLPQPEGRCNAVFVDDVAQAILRAAALPDLERERFIISGPEPIAWSEFFHGYASILGTGKVRHKPARALLDRLGPEPLQTKAAAGPSVAARISAVGRRILGRERFEAIVFALRRRINRPAGEIHPDRHMIGLYSGQGVCCIDRACGRLGYRPEYSFAEGLAATTDYLRTRYSTGRKAPKHQG